MNENTAEIDLLCTGFIFDFYVNVMRIFDHVKIIDVFNDFVDRTETIFRRHVYSLKCLFND